MLEHIRTLERARFSAMIAGDLDSLSALLDNELIYVHSSGQADSKNAYLRSLQQGQIAYENIEVLGDRHWDGEGCFVIMQSILARMRVGAGAEPIERRLTITSVWRQTSGEWRLIALQSTAVT
jgi:hypothetical protein